MISTNVSMTTIKAHVHATEKSMEQLTKIMQNFQIPNLEAISKSFVSSQRTILKMMADSNLQSIIESAVRNRPSNYSGLLIVEQIRLVEASFDHIFGTFESLPESVIRELLSSDFSDLAVSNILLKSETQIIEYIRSMVDLIHNHEGTENQFLRILLQSCDAFEDGHFNSSQVLATVNWDSFLTQYAKVKWRTKKFITEVKNESSSFDIDTSDSFESLYVRIAYCPIIASYIEPEDSTRYSRNATIHNAGEGVLHKLNSLKSLTIASGLLQYAWRKGDLYFPQTQ